MRTTAIILTVMTLATLGASPAQQKQLDIKPTILGRPEHPTVYLSKGDILRARENRDRYPWAKTVAERLLKEADTWTDRSDEELLKLIPGRGACFAYGFADCPVCGGNLAAWWGAGGVASLDDPGHIRCVNGHRLPDEAHPDSGDGYTAPGGKKHYFVGTYNAFVVDTLTSALTHLVHAYALTENKTYAHKAALILDHLAAVYPSCDKGSWDYPSSPPSGRFNRPWYQVARTLVHYANHYDILLMGDTLDQPSCVAGMTRRQNIEENLLLNGARYCYEISVKQPALHNGQADYIRGVMVVGVAMGIPEYVAWTTDGPYSIRAMLANNVDRDGQYYETSTGYSDHARALYMNMAEILQRYSDSAHPNGIRLIDDPTFVAFNLLPRGSLHCAGHEPNLGDDTPGHKRVPPATRPTDAYDLLALERLRALNTDPARDRELLDLFLEASEGDVEGVRAETPAGEWLLFHAREAKRPENAGQVHHHSAVATSSDLFSQMGFAILRSGTGEDARAVTLRAGPTLNHGHFDEMGLHVYARGYELTYDIGYILGSTHTQQGWAKTTASHNLVLVDETTQLKSGRAGGSIERYVSLPGVSYVRANDPACYASQEVRRYARTVAMIDVSPRASYALDIFRVEGGNKHDYIFHALGDDVAFAGIDFGSEQPGSLAGPDVNWGDRLGSDGDVIGVANKPYWNPPPGNGLGFMMRPRVASKQPEGGWSATWTADATAAARIRLTMPDHADGKVVTCLAPGNYPNLPKSRYLVVRRVGENLKSTFAGIIEPYADQPSVRGVRKLEPKSDDAVGLRVELLDGRVDYLIHREPTAETVEWRDSDRVIRFDGEFALIRWANGKTDKVTVIGGTRLAIDGHETSIPPPIVGTIERIDYENAILFTKNTLEPGDALARTQLYVSNPQYAQSSAYEIAKVTREGELSAIHLAPTRLTLARGHLDATPTNPAVLPNVTPIEYAKSLVHKSSGFFRGKLVTTPDHRASTHILDFDDKGMTLTVRNSTSFSAGDDLVIFDLQPGDRFTLPTALTE